MANDPSPLEMARRHKEAGRLALAAEEYEQHLRAHPEEGGALLDLAGVYELLGAERAAADAYLRMGRLDAPRSITMLRRAHWLVPGDAEVCRELVGLLREAGHTEEAVKVLETAARVAAGRGAGGTRRQLLEELLELDPARAAAAMALADVLIQEGRQQEAAERLREGLARLDEERRWKERLELLERLQPLVPEDREVVLAAARLALKHGQTRRMLVLLRRALDAQPEDPELYALAAQGLRKQGDVARALLVHREAARTFSELERWEQARGEWLEVLRDDPADEEARAALGSTPETRPGQAPEEPREAPVSAAEPHQFEVTPEDLLGGALVLERDAPPSAVAHQDAGVGRGREDRDGESVFILPDALELELELEAPTGRVVRRALGMEPDPAPLRHVAPLPRRALVMGEGPEAGWIRRALEDAGVECFVEGEPPGEYELVVAPAARAEELRARGPWKVLCFPTLGGREVREALRARGLPVVEVSPAPEARVYVAAASDGRHAFGLAEWRETNLESSVVVESPAGEEEGARLALAGRGMGALGLLGVAVIVLARHRGVWSIESLGGTPGPGGLVVESRTGLSLPRLALGLLRGETLEEAPRRRGHALAALLSRLEPAALGNLRLEPAADGASAFVCAHDLDREVAARRLARALTGTGGPGQRRA